MGDNNKQYYVLYLDDYSSPSFISSIKEYYGTIEEISSLMNCLSAADKKRECYSSTLKAFESFQSGDAWATHHTVCGERLLMKSVELMGMASFERGEMQWNHRNVWGCTYRMRASSVRISQLLLKDGEKYIRVIKPSFKNLVYKTEDLLEEGWMPFSDDLWGFPCMYDVSGKWHNLRMYVTEQEYKKPKDALADINDISKISFRSACDDLFGNG